MTAEKAPGFTGKAREKQGRRAKRARPATPAYLERAGLFYLQRFASSTENFKAVMRRKVRQRGLAEGVSDDEAEGWIDALAARFERSGLLDDAAYARGRARSLFARGKSQRVIRRTLAAKGVDTALIDHMMESLFHEVPNPDLSAAIAFARRRRLGPFGRSDRSGGPSARDKELAAMARAGFSYGIACRVLDAETPEELEEHAVKGLV